MSIFILRVWSFGKIPSLGLRGTRRHANEHRYLDLFLSVCLYERVFCGVFTPNHLEQNKNKAHNHIKICTAAVAAENITIICCVCVCASFYSVNRPSVKYITRCIGKRIRRNAFMCTTALCVFVCVCVMYRKCKVHNSKRW